VASYVLPLDDHLSMDGSRTRILLVIKDVTTNEREYTYKNRESILLPGKEKAYQASTLVGFVTL